MGHDQLFKEFLHAFMQEFMGIFYPEVAKRLKFETIEFLSTELFTDFPEAPVREVDVVAKLRTHQGSPELILIHIEIQARPEADFGARMFQYYALLGHRFQLPVFPVVVHIRGGPGGRTQEIHRVSLFDQEQLVFRYHNVGLAQLDAEGVFSRRASCRRGLGSADEQRKLRAGDAPSPHEARGGRG